MKPDKVFKDLIASTSQLADDIRRQATRTDTQDNDELNGSIKIILVRLYSMIVCLGENKGHPPPPNKAIVDAYRCFFEPIHALSQLPNGDFLAARMFLYLASAFVHEKSLNLRFSESKAPGATAFLYGFCVELDDALLDPLKRMWAKGDKCDDFGWVFSDHPVQRFVAREGSEGDGFRHLELAQALSADELTALGGGRGRRWFWSAPGDEKGWKSFSGKLPEVSDGDKDKVVWKCVGTDGPIREDRIYRTVGKDACEESSKAVEVLPRSRQFIFDARQIAKPLVHKQKVSLLSRTLFRAGVPAEVRDMVWQHMDEPPKESTYLSGLDIAAAYAPFPKPPEHCTECETRRAKGIGQSLKYTCPERNIYLWNLGLRLFHVFHQRSRTGWGLCKEGFGCSGHHADDDWQILDCENLLNLLDDINAERSETFTELCDDDGEQIPLRFQTSLNEDEARRESSGPVEDSVREEELMDGIRALLGTMAHKELITSTSPESGGSGQIIREAQWAVARNLVDQTKGELRIVKLLIK
ncbi:hypothetical protein EDB81DRAFT_864418 [Dactylonectria macrodidyma]|uniref:Uncharacterized protein n=1 Tax=Dactylonectria macrodidyma TaxID=307937 RepID=A0A9P9JPE8_9HYPO|nr:hypothetical protein EDB81DRAFT_864418 [Dactylonectria macrodidyma]